MAKYGLVLAAGEKMNTRPQRRGSVPSFYFMNRKWDKIDLENLIFYLAARHGQKIWFCAGVAYTKGKSAILQKLLLIYNRYFTAENKVFLKEDCAESKRENFFFQKQFERETKQKVLAKSFCLALLHQPKQACKKEKFKKRQTG